MRPTNGCIKRGGLRQTGAVKIHADVYLAEAAYKAPGGLIRATARRREGRVDDLSLSGDFTVLPIFAVGALEQALRGLALEAGPLRARVADFYRSLPVQSPGVSVDDWVSALMAIKGQAPSSSLMTSLAACDRAPPTLDEYLALRPRFTVSRPLAVATVAWAEPLAQRTLGAYARRDGLELGDGLPLARISPRRPTTAAGPS